MTEALIHAQDVFLDKINQMCGKFGLNNIMAQLYAILYLSGKPLSLNDMVERLKISKGSASINIRALERYGVVRKVWVKGSRRDYYEAEEDISKVMMNRIKSMAHGRLAEVEEMLRSSYEAVNSIEATDKEEKERVKVFKQKLAEIQNIHKKAQSLFNLFNSGLLSNVNVLSVKTRKNDKKEMPVSGGKLFVS